MIFKENLLSDSPEEKVYRFDWFSDDEKISMSHSTMILCDTMYNGEFIKTMAWGGVRTPPQYRRNGCVRKTFEEILPRASEFGAAVSLLHPFSFSYYRKMGYERVADIIEAKFPITALDFLPRFPDLVPYDDSMLDKFLVFFEKFAKNRNTMMYRTSGKFFDGKTDLFFRSGIMMTYVLMRNDEIQGYVVYSPKKHFNGFNKMESDELLVYELGFLDKQALIDILGFLRMYDGELETVTLHNIAPIPEVDYVLRHYMHTKYRIVPDISARILDTKTMLEKCKYPCQDGSFTVKINDYLPNVAGVYNVEYGNNGCKVKQLDDTSDCNIEISAASMVQIMYGYNHIDKDTLCYADGVKINKNAEDFFRAFPKKINGAYEFF